MAKPKGDWIHERKICEYCKVEFGPRDNDQQFFWRKRRFCSKTCSGKCAPRTPLMNNDDKFWPKVDKSPGHGPNGDCWLWTGGKAHYGHGRFSNGPRKIYAHRYSYLIHKGEMGDFDVCHHCDNPSCVNPDHLFLGTHEDNMKDMGRKGRASWGVRSWSAKLTEDDVRAIRKDTRINRLIGEQYGVPTNHICNIKNRKSWKNLPD